MNVMMLKLSFLSLGNRFVFFRYSLIVFELGVSEFFIYGLCVRFFVFVLCVSKVVVIMLCGLLVFV